MRAKPACTSSHSRSSRTTTPRSRCTASSASSRRAGACGTTAGRAGSCGTRSSWDWSFRPSRGATTVWQSDAVATMADLDELALALPQTTKEVSEDGRPTYLVHGKAFCLHRSRRPDAIDAETGERLDDVLMFRVS